MSEPEQARRMRIVAVSAALIAVAFALAAVIVVLLRGEHGAPAAKGSVLVVDRDVHAPDVVRLRGSAVERVLENGIAKGVRVTDTMLAQALGLEPGDVITSLSGKPMADERDTYGAVLRLGLMDAKTLYVELLRDGKPVLARWRLDDALTEARHAAFGSSAPPSNLTPLSPLPPSPADPVLDTIERLDDTHYRVPRATVDALLADPSTLAKGARVVPAIRNGQPDGFKLYAIRPSSVYARIGLQNGDTIRAINGYELTSPDKALELYTKVRNANDLTFDLWRRGKSVMLNVEITK
ncbi:MAG TPA: type II secretion system protein GspC [Kofleriaceae bacterium]|nr:type II secretion system protein GspC [Kofleriaceae bacterium]